MPVRGHVPIRTCLVCASRRPKRSLLRLALDAHRMIAPDPGQRAAGRGAYVCPQCLHRLRLTKRVQKAFRYRAEGLAEDPGS